MLFYPQQSLIYLIPTLTLALSFALALALALTRTLTLGISTDDVRMLRRIASATAKAAKTPDRTKTPADWEVERRTEGLLL